MSLEIDISLLNSYLSGALTFINNYKRDSYPLIISTKSLLPNSFHAVEGRRNYFPGSKLVGCATSEAMTSFARACFYAWEATGNVAWKNLGLDVIQSFTDYFFIESIPSTSQIWDSHWLCIAFGSTPTKGAQPTTTPPTDPFNYGNFDTSVNFTNGIGTLGTGSLLADVYKVYVGNLKFKNIYSPLIEGGTEYAIDYWVVNYSLEGVNYRVKPDGTRSQTTDAIGTIKLTTNFTGTAKVAWSDYSGGTLSAPISPRQGQGLIEPYPFWQACVKPDGRTILNTAFDTYWWGFDAFELAFKHTNINSWRNAANSFKFTAQQSMLIENLSYYHKKEQTSYPFRYPGTQAFTTNNGSNPAPTLTASREFTNNNQLGYLVLNMGSPVANSYPTLEFQNYIVQTQLTENVSIFVETSINVDTILEIKLSISQDLFDTSQEYIAYWKVTGNTVERNIDLTLNNFIRWGSSICWHPKIAEEPIFTYSGNGGSVTYRINQDFVFSDGTKPLLIDVTLVKGAGFAGFGLNNCNFSNFPPSIRYEVEGNLKMRIKDSNDAYWYCTLPSGDFVTFIGNWNQFTGTGTPGTGNIKEVVFEVDSGTARILCHYLVNDTNYTLETIPISTTVYRASLVSKARTAHTLKIGTFRPQNNPLDKIPYVPGAVPFTRNTIRVPKSGGGYETISDSWGQGMIYMGYLSPYHQYIWGNKLACDNQISMLTDSFTAYTNQSSSRLRGLPQQVFLAALWDSAAFATYGEKLPPLVKRMMGFLIPFIFDKISNISGNSYIYKLNIFSWKGADPNTNWFPYAARVMESTARYVYANPNDQKAKALITQYLQFLLDDYNYRGSIAPLTDIVPESRPQSNYNEPHAAALIGRCALWANLAGLNVSLTTDVLDICYRYIISQYVGTGTMTGSFAAGQPNFTHSSITYKEYFSFWHGEIVEFLALLVKYNDFISYPSLSTPGIYPSVEPTKITSVKEANFKSSIFRFSDGNRQSLLNRKTQANKEITLEYFNVSEDELEIFTEFYRIHGTTELFALPSDVPILQRFRLYGSTVLYWRIAQPISFDTVVANSNRGVFKFSITIICD
jgi:hypothetical protein